MPARIEWSGDDVVRANMAAYGQRVQAAKLAVANYWAPVLEAYAKENAPWTDRTGNARQALHSFVRELSSDTVALYLSHGMSYGVFLELRWAGRYAVILPTLQQHYGAVAQMLRDIFR